MRLYFEYLGQNFMRTVRFWNHVETALLALVPSLLAAIALAVARIEKPKSEGLLEAAREVFRDEFGDVLFALLVALGVFFLIALVFINPISMWVEQRRRVLALEDPAVPLALAWVGESASGVRSMEVLAGIVYLTHGG